jgi:hypothetical protein
MVGIPSPLAGPSSKIQTQISYQKISAWSNHIEMHITQEHRAWERVEKVVRMLGKKKLSPESTINF